MKGCDAKKNEVGLDAEERGERAERPSGRGNDFGEYGIAMMESAIITFLSFSRSLSP
jgi:hypothetical protein